MFFSLDNRKIIYILVLLGFLVSLCAILVILYQTTVREELKWSNRIAWGLPSSVIDQESLVNIHQEAKGVSGRFFGQLNFQSYNCTDRLYNCNDRLIWLKENYTAGQKKICVLFIGFRFLKVSLWFLFSAWIFESFQQFLQFQNTNLYFCWFFRNFYI